MENHQVLCSALKLGITKSIPPIVATTSHHFSWIIHSLNLDRLTKQTYCDVFIYADKLIFPVHRCIVGMFTDFHGALLPNPLTPPIYLSNKLVINTVGIQQSTMGVILDFIYTSLITITKENVYNVLHASDFLSIAPLKKTCMDYLIQNSLEITFINPLNMEQVDESTNEQNTSAQPVGSTSDIQSVSTTPGQSPDRIQSLNNSDFVDSNTRPEINNTVKKITICSSCSPHKTLNLDVIKVFKDIQKKTENDNKKMFKEIISWVKVDENERKNDFCLLFSEINLKRLGKSFIQNYVMNEKLIQNCDQCQKLVLPLIQDDIPSPEKKLNKKLENPYEFIVYGGGFSKEKSVQKYDIITKKWTTMENLPEGHYGSTAAKIGDHIYLLGGEHFLKYVTRTNVTDPEKRWKAVCSMNVEKQCTACAVLNDCIYVVGGHDKEGTAISCGEFYDPKVNEWVNIDDMNCKRSGLGFAKAGGLLYAIGGIDNNKNELSSVECYNPSNGKWINVASMTFPRHRFAAVGYNNMIYATGGLHNSKRTNLVELYDTAADIWEQVAPMTHPRAYHCACVLNNTIYVVGGAESLAIELYDPKRDQWKIEKEKISPRFGSALVVI